MLNFNPYFRPSARDLLKNPIFAAQHEELREQPCDKKIVIDLDTQLPHKIDDNFEYVHYKDSTL